MYSLGTLRTVGACVCSEASEANNCCNPAAKDYVMEGCKLTGPRWWPSLVSCGRVSGHDDLRFGSHWNKESI